ncbi:MAG: response regulator [Burkholderiaceae bacterium]|nr:response regulator [Burkholderiaceae bacterium]
MTVKEAADALSLSTTSVQLLVERGALKAWRTAGGHRRILPDSVLALLRDRGLAERPVVEDVKVEPESEEAGRNASEQPKPDAALDVLIAEDDPFFRELYQTKLRSIGLPVELRFAFDGVQALLALGSRVPDVLILDLGLPALNGIDTLYALRKDARTARLPVIVATGMSADKIAALGSLPPGSVLVHKPVQFERLRGYLEAIYCLRQIA